MRRMILGLLLAINACNSPTETPANDHGAVAADPSGERGGVADDGTTNTMDEIMPITAALVMNKQADDQLKLRARVIYSKSAFEFYEPSPGRVLYSELLQQGMKGHRYLTDGHTSVVEVYKKLMPGKPVPQELTDLDKRVTANAEAEAGNSGKTSGKGTSSASGGSQALTATPLPAITVYSDEPMDDIETTTSALSIGEIQCGTPPPFRPGCDHAWFKSNMCTIDLSGVSHYNWCLFNWSGGRSTWAGGDEDSAYGAVNACNGSLLFKLTADFGGGAWTVTAGYSRWARPGTNCERWCYPFCSWCATQNIRYDITATGVAFDHCGTFNNQN